MLHATLRQAVQAFIREKGRPPVVLDIGCGTGLLSMLAVRAGASEVYGCELYEPLAQIAREVTELNSGDKVKASVRAVVLSLRRLVMRHEIEPFPSSPLSVCVYNSSCVCRGAKTFDRRGRHRLCHLCFRLSLPECSVSQQTVVLRKVVEATLWLSRKGAAGAFHRMRAGGREDKTRQSTSGMSTAVVLSILRLCLRLCLSKSVPPTRWLLFQMGRLVWCRVVHLHIQTR